MTLFRQLYLGTLAMLLLTALLIFFGFNYYETEDNINDFLRDVEKATADLQAEIITQDKHAMRVQITEIPVCQQFCLSWLGDQDLARFSDSAELLRENTSRAIYQLQRGCELAVVYAHPKLGGYLMVRDSPDNCDHHHGGDSEGDGFTPEKHLPLLFILLAGLGIGSVLFFLSKRIEKAIVRLQNVVSAYDTHPEARADENSPEPVRQLALSFNQLADRLDDQYREQQIMTHAVAHEIRTPLTRMRLALGMIDDEQHRPETRALLSSLDEYVTDMDQLTKEVLLLGRINEAPDQLPVEFVNFSDLVKQRVSFLSAAQNTKVASVITPDMQIAMVPRHAQLMIDNLVNNALAYAHSQVTVELRGSSKNKEQLGKTKTVFQVRDDGPGIAEKHMDSLFVPFFRGDESRDRKTGGFGLGLAIVHSIVRRYGGEIVVNNHPQGGAVFSLSFDA